MTLFKKIKYQPILYQVNAFSSILRSLFLWPGVQLLILFPPLLIKKEKYFTLLCSFCPLLYLGLDFSYTRNMHYFLLHVSKDSYASMPGSNTPSSLTFLIAKRKGPLVPLNYHTLCTLR